ncbi:VanZ family protein [Agreia sp. COWG]|uniref:VanZ family protein n=1 Tax=Agreia sp. COWG TaxID=2773266 RepID=UPI0019286BB5|nr:VanZ family protein [Agreia sp. COWG]CAD5991294.1 membrane protein of unknown function [Agreia sp. COWG]
MHTQPLRRWAWIGLAAIAAAVLLITFWPTPVDAPVHNALARQLAIWHTQGLPSWITYSVIEMSSNVVMFIPLGVFIAIIAMPTLWWASGLLGLVASLCIELGQYLLLPHRFASPVDVATNTAGALLGGAIVAVSRLWEGRASGRSF